MRIVREVVSSAGIVVRYAEARCASPLCQEDHATFSAAMNGEDRWVPCGAPAEDVLRSFSAEEQEAVMLGIADTLERFGPPSIAAFGLCWECLSEPGRWVRVFQEMGLCMREQQTVMCAQSVEQLRDLRRLVGDVAGMASALACLAPYIENVGGRTVDGYVT